MANANMHKAKKEKNDEFYTSDEDVATEMQYYKKYFEGKVVFCNCDEGPKSAFFKFFKEKFIDFKLKKLIALGYTTDGDYAFKYEFFGDTNGDGKVNHLDIIKTPLTQNGDFRSDEAIAILQEADIVVTNPPFKNAGEFVSHALTLVPKVVMLLRLAFLESERRRDILDIAPLARVHVFRKRLPMMHRAGQGIVAPDRQTCSALAFAWFVWEQGHQGPATLHRVSWEEFVPARAA